MPELDNIQSENVVYIDDDDDTDVVTFILCKARMKQKQNIGASKNTRERQQQWLVCGHSFYET